MKTTPASITARLSLIAAAGLLGACSSMGSAPMASSQSGLPDTIKVPAGNRLAWETTTVGGEITYECRDKANAAGQTEWTFVGPKAVLNDRSGKQVGTYFGPPATWQAKDGTTRPSLDLVADEVATTTPRPRKRKEGPTGPAGGHGFGDLPGAGDVDWMGA